MWKVEFYYRLISVIQAREALKIAPLSQLGFADGDQQKKILGELQREAYDDFFEPERNADVLERLQREGSPIPGLGND